MAAAGKALPSTSSKTLVEWCQSILGERGEADAGYVSEVYHERLRKKQLILETRRSAYKQRLAKKQDGKEERLGKKTKCESRKAKSSPSKKDLTLVYAQVIGLNDYWHSYINELCQDLSLNDPLAQLGPRLAKADLHGSVLQVIKSVNPSLIGIQGMLLLETEKTLKLCCRDDRTRSIPKPGSIFGLECRLTKRGQVQTLTFQLHGNQLLGRAPDRAAKKYKFRPTTDLGS